jgi:uncharacterized protein DUF4154
MTAHVQRSTLRPFAPRKRAWLAYVAAAACCWLVAAVALAQDTGLTASAHAVKAAYLFKLPAYVEWPAQRFEEPDSALIVGVLGADDVAEALAALTADRTVNGRRVVVRRLRPDDELTGVHVLFFGEPAHARADRIAVEAAAQNILTVTDFQAGAQDSVIEFVTTNGKLRFEVRLDTADSNGLRLHSGLLSVAARVHGPGQR